MAAFFFCLVFEVMMTNEGSILSIEVYFAGESQYLMPLKPNQPSDWLVFKDIVLINHLPIGLSYLKLLTCKLFRPIQFILAE